VCLGLLFLYSLMKCLWNHLVLPGTPQWITRATSKQDTALLLLLPTFILLPSFSLRIVFVSCLPEVSSHILSDLGVCHHSRIIDSGRRPTFCGAVASIMRRSPRINAVVTSLLHPLRTASHHMFGPPVLSDLFGCRPLYESARNVSHWSLGLPICHADQIPLEKCIFAATFPNIALHTQRN